MTTLNIPTQEADQEIKEYQQITIIQEEQAMNNSFQTGTFDGFTVTGRCKIIQKISHRGQGWISESGHYMALLDDPRLVDNDGWRTVDDQVPASYSSPQAAVVDYSFNPDTNGRITHGVDGARLQTGFLMLLQGQTVSIVWNFLIGDHIPGHNDFALLQIIDDQNQLIFETVLYQATEKLSAWASGWRVSEWTCPADCTASIAITVANGYQVNPGIEAGDATLQDASRYPSGLLLDSIEIVGA